MSAWGNWRRKRSVRLAAILAVAALLAVGLWQLFLTKPGLTGISADFKSVMGVRAKLVVFVPHGQEALADQAIQAALAELTRVDNLTASDNPKSEIALFNGAPAGKMVKFSPTTMEIMKLARSYAAYTGGAFDVTCRPLLVLWKKAQEQNRVPTDQEIGQAVAKVGWHRLKLFDDGASKIVDGVEIELAGISRGYAMDLAAEAMRRCGVAGGMVNLGDDYRVFGRHGGGDVWLVPVRNPFGGEKPLATLRVREGAVCTRSNYEKSYVIGGKRLGRIVDPWTGTPADLVPSTTIMSGLAIDGAWTTAMSVSGPKGIVAAHDRAVLHTMMVTGDKENWRVLSSPEFDELLETPIARQSAASAPAKGPQP